MDFHDEHSASDVFIIYFILLPIGVFFSFYFGREMEFKGILSYFVLMPIVLVFFVRFLMESGFILNQTARTFMRRLLGFFGAIGVGGICLGFARYF